MKVMILGADSTIAQETAKQFALAGAELFLVARFENRLEAVAADLKVRGAKQVKTFKLDLTDLDRHQELFDEAIRELDGLEYLLIAYGTLGDQIASQKNVAETLKELNTNLVSVISLLTIAANYFEQERHGCIAAISSAAGDRGRQSNYVYGTAKGAISIFMQGLRNRLYRSGVAVVTIKPGRVDTPMTAAFKKTATFASPQTVGIGIYKAMIARRGVVYLPWFWRYIMLLIRNIPEPIFKRMSM